MTIELVPEFRFSHQGLSPRNGAPSHTLRGQLVEDFANRLYLSDGGAFLITGYRGVGKTTFVNEALGSLRKKLVSYCPDPALRPILLDVQLNIARPLSGAELMHSILRQLYKRLVELKLLSLLPRDLREQIELSLMRTSAQLALTSSEASESSMSLDRWLKFNAKFTSGRSRDISYLAYDERSAETDLIALAHRLSQGFTPSGLLGLRALFSRPKRLKLLFVFDELDKIDETEGNESSLSNILHSLKTLFTTSGISFIFVAGRALHERWKRDVQRGDSVFESVFTESHYLPASWDQVDAICDPFLADRHALSDYSQLLYSDFKRFLAFKGRGIPRRILRGFYDKVNWDGRCARLVLSEKDRRRIRFYAEMYQMLSKSEEAILGDHAQELRPEVLDKQRLGIYYILDWILARGSLPFTLAELIDAASKELKAGIAPARELTPMVVTGLVELLRQENYLEEFTNPDETVYDKSTIARHSVKYRLLNRRLIEMGLYREIKSQAWSPEDSASELPVLAQRYQLLELLGRGSSAEVYKALDRNTGNYVALKYFFAGFFSSDSTLEERLSAEVAVQAQLRHPGIAAFLDVNMEGDRPFTVMEYLQGVGLRQLMSSNQPLPVAESLSIIMALLKTLQYLHEKNVVWRDVKPSNILVTDEGRVVIVDFGTAQTLRNADSGPDTTRVGFAAGTPTYMSPEQVRGEALTPSSDLFSLAIILFEMLSGQRPWSEQGPLELYQRWHEDSIDTLPAFKQLPCAVQKPLAKALYFEPARRFQQASEFLAALPANEHDSQLKYYVQGATRVQDGAAEDVDVMTIAVRAPDSIQPAPQPSTDTSPKTPPVPAPEPTLAPEVAPPQAPTSESAPIPEANWAAPTERAASTGAEAAQISPYPAPARLSGERADGIQTVAREIDPTQMTHPRGYALLVLDEPQAEKSRHIGLFNPPLTLGRSAESDLQIFDTTASRYHARIEYRDDHYWLEELNSSNGVNVNGQRIYQQQALQDGDSIVIGVTTMTFLMPERLPAEKGSAFK